MRWGVQYQLESGTIGLMLFSADDYLAANLYVLEMLIVYGYQRVFNLQPVSSVEELLKLFPASK
jgi:hypothetical protein